MRKLLTATAALAFVGGAAFAEINISGSAEFGIDYDSEPGENMSKHSFVHDMEADFSGSGTTDGGLSFGGKVGIGAGANEVDEGTVYISGSFGKVTFGDAGRADELAGGIADVGMNGIGVDNIAEFTYGNTADEARYDHSFGNIAFAVSMGTATANPELGLKKNEWAVGMKISMSGATVGLGHDSRKASSLGLGYATGEISFNALYSQQKESNRDYSTSYDPGTPDDATDDVRLTASGPKLTSIGADMSYKIGASMLTLAYGKTTIGSMSVVTDNDADGTDDTRADIASGSFSGMGVGISHDLGGGAKLVAGFGKIDATDEINVSVAAPGTAVGGITPYPVSYEFAEHNKASVGLMFSF